MSDTADEPNMYSLPKSPDDAQRYTLERTSMAAKPVSGIQLTQKTKIIIGVVIGLAVLGAVIGVVAYYVSVKPKNGGKTKFGTLQVTDTTTNSTNVVAPGDVLQLKFSPNPGDGFTGLANWAVSFDAGQSFTSLAVAQSGNTYKYTVPADTCSDGVVFKVTDSKLLNDFVTSDKLAIHPVLEIIEGPGVESGSVVYMGSSVSSIIEFDASLANTSLASNWRVDISSDSAFSKPVQQTVTSFDGTAKSLTWSPSGVLANAYIRVSMTSPVGTCQAPLFVVAPFTFNITTVPVCAGTELKICTMSMMANGVELTKYYPTQAVTLQFSYVGPRYARSESYYYSIDGVATTIAASALGPQVITDSTVSVTWTIPSTIFTDSFSVSVIQEPSAVTSSTYSCKPLVVIDTPIVAASVTSADLPVIISVTTDVHVLPVTAAEFTTWTVGYGDTSSAVYVAATLVVYTASTNSYAITWNFTSAQLGLNKVGDTVSKYVYFKGTDATGSTASMVPAAVTFTYSAWSPSYAVFNGQPPLSIGGDDLSMTISGTSIPMNGVTTQPTNFQYWIALNIDKTLLKANVCNFNPADPPVTVSDIMCIGSTTTPGIVPAVALSAAPLVSFTHNTNSTTFPLCIATSTAISVFSPLVAMYDIHTVAGATCSGSYVVGSAYTWSVNPFF